jgi:hypothetical protein
MTDYKQICRNLIAAIRAEARERTLGFELLKAYVEADAVLTSMSELSPAAQAVLDAFRTSHTGQGCLAAALRAAADQLAVTDEDHDLDAPWEEGFTAGMGGAHDALLAVADELEAQ